jgi:arylformamidase
MLKGGFIAMKIIDLSVVLRKDSISLVPGHPDFELKDFHFHDKDFRSNSFFGMSIHTGTHVDAPYHFIKDGVTIDDLPLETIVGTAVLIDLRTVCAPQKGISLDQTKEAVGEKDIKGKIVILHSGWIKEKWGTMEMYEENPFLMQDTANWLVDQEIRSVGIDFVIDNPDQSDFPVEKRFPNHRTFLGHGIPIIENLCNLEFIDRDEFLFIVLPLKLHKCNGAPARAIALID